MDHKDYVNRAVEASIHIGLVILLAATCFSILRPFIPLIAWSVIVAIAVYPRYRQLQLVLGGRGVLAAVLITLLLLALLIVPVVLLSGTLIGGIQALAAHLKDGTPIVPPPPAGVETWPIVGVPLKNAWSLASTNITAALRNFAPQIKAIVPGLLSASAGIGLTVLQFALSLIIAGVLLGNSRGAAGAAHSLANRIFGDKGPEFEQLVGSTVRSVTIGILRRGPDPIGSRGSWFSCGRNAGCRLVGRRVSSCRIATGGDTGPCSRRDLCVRDI